MPLAARKLTSFEVKYINRIVVLILVLNYYFLDVKKKSKQKLHSCECYEIEDGILMIEQTLPTEVIMFNDKLTSMSLIVCSL